MQPGMAVTEELECCKGHDTKGGLQEGGDDDEEAAPESSRVAHCQKQRQNCFCCGGPAQHHPLQSHRSLSLSLRDPDCLLLRFASVCQEKKDCLSLCVCVCVCVLTNIANYVFCFCVFLHQRLRLLLLNLRLQ